jgi:hypothetical protein
MYSDLEMNLLSKKWNNWRKYYISKHRKNYSLNQINTYLCIRKINIYSCYVLNKLLLHLVFPSKFERQYFTQTYRITSVSLHFSFNLFIRLPNNSDIAWDRYVTPFSCGLWLAVAIAACAISVCMALTNHGHEGNESLTVSAILFHIHACFCQQGQSENSCCLPSLFLYVL